MWCGALVFRKIQWGHVLIRARCNNNLFCVNRSYVTKILYSHVSRFLRFLNVSQKLMKTFGNVTFEMSFSLLFSLQLSEYYDVFWQEKMLWWQRWCVPMYRNVFILFLSPFLCLRLLLFRLFSSHPCPLKTPLNSRWSFLDYKFR